MNGGHRAFGGRKRPDIEAIICAGTSASCGRRRELVEATPMNLPRRKLLQMAAGAVALTMPRARAQSYPARPVHIIVGFSAGINPDIIARLFAQSLSDQLGQQFVVEDRPGAASNIGTEVVVRAAADGYTLLAVTSTNVINASFYNNLNFDFVRDIVPIAGTVRLPDVLAVTPSLPAKTIPELIDYAKANPGKVSMASTGTGAASHVIGELFKTMTNTDLLHVPYRASFMTDLLAGHVHLSFIPIAACVEFVKDGRLRAIAVTSTARLAALPDVPAVAEFVPGYEAYVWDGIGAPRGTPAAIIDRLNKAINVSLADSTMKARLADLGAEPMPMTPAEFGAFIASEAEKWGRVVRAAQIKPE
jgi:tripartite-type tricarboxylate transporter receptor subunit TctC